MATKGHWPRGKRRNPRPPAGFTRQLKRLVARHGLRGAAARIGCDPKAVRHWMVGEDWPRAERAAAVMTL